MNERNQLEFLDMLGVLSFALQLTNQRMFVSMADIHQDNDRILKDIHQHLEKQDQKLDEIWRYLHEADRTSGRPD